jgi:hypothetical protein
VVSGSCPSIWEPAGRPLRPDRAFVRSGWPAHDHGPGRPRRALEAAGHPVIRIELGDPIDLGAEFIRWEVATAIAGAVLGIDPFDQPNVEEAKQLTRDVLARHGQDGAGPTAAPAVLATGDGLTLHGDAALRLTSRDGSVTTELARHLARRRPNAYLCLQAFIAPTPGRDEAMAGIRTLLRDRTGRATTAAVRPRSSIPRAAHKAGWPAGSCNDATTPTTADPGWPYTFGQLIDAQASGDFAAIESHDLPILRVHLGADPDAGLAALERAIVAALDTPTEA